MSKSLFQIIEVLIFVILFTFSSTMIGQSIQNINIEQVRDTINIRYDLVSIRNDDIYEINLSVSDNNGEKFNIIPQSVSGDIGYGIKPASGKIIKWTPLKDSLELVGDNFFFKLKGELIGASKYIDFVKIKGGSFMMGSDSEYAKTD